MAVRVRLDETRPFGNHLPEIRPADPKRLVEAEQRIGRAIYRILKTPVTTQDTPLDTAIETLGRYEEQQDALLAAVEATVRLGIKEGDARTRRDVNEHLRQMGSPVRLVAPDATRGRAPSGTEDEVKKAATIVEVVYSSADSSAFTSPVIQGAAEMSLEATRRITADLAASTTEALGVAVEEILLSVKPVGMEQETVRELERSIDAILAQDERGTEGLTARQAISVHRQAATVLRSSLERGLSHEAAVGAYNRVWRKEGDRKRRQRARAIARTETNRAVNRATDRSFRNAMASGLLETGTEIQWVTGPFDVCDICLSLAGKTISAEQAIGARFTSRLQSTALEYPPAHPNCRCKIRLVPVTGRPRLVGSNTPDDPMRYEFPAGFTSDLKPAKLPDAIRPERTRAAFTRAEMMEKTQQLKAEARRRKRAADERLFDAGDPNLGVLQGAQGFDGKGTVLKGAEFLDNYRPEDGDLLLFRGIKGAGETSVGYAQALIDGEYFPGRGIYGQGTYMTTTYDEAQSYAGDRGSVVAAILPKEYLSSFRAGELQREASQFAADLEEALLARRPQKEDYYDTSTGPISDNFDYEGLKRWQAADDRWVEERDALRQQRYLMFSDPGYYAVTVGIDAYPTKVDNYFVIQNRTALMWYDQPLDPVRGRIVWPHEE